MLFDKLSKIAKNELLKDIDPNSKDYDISVFASVADDLDRRNLFMAADTIDEFIQQYAEKMELSHKKVAKSIRDKRRNVKTAEVDVNQIAAYLKLDLNILQALTPQQLEYISKIKNPILAKQWIEKFQLDNKNVKVPIEDQKPERMPTGEKDVAPSKPMKKELPIPLSGRDQ